ncbi:MAG: type VI secretion system ATPase TssH [Ignavibacterium sp.]|jgi:type VI secretion system protein VasG|nr:type VI secretion system ATPase TssH [Ignavibacterium sp.]
MQSKDLKSLLVKLNNYLIRNLDTATGLGINRSHYEITFDHLLNCLIEDGMGDVPLILKHYNIDAGEVQSRVIKNLEEMTKGNTGKPKLSPLLAELLEQAWITSSVHHHETKIRSGALFEVFIASEQAISSNLLNILAPIKQEELKTEFYNILKGSVEDASVASEMLSAEEAKEIPADGTVLDLFTTNLTAQAKDGKIDPILGRDDEIIQVIEVLSRRKKSNPIILGEPGVGKTALVEGLAIKIASDEVPDVLKNNQIYSLDLGSLQAGTKMRGEFEKRLKAVITEIANSPTPAILFIDEAHTLIGAGASAGGGDAANLLKPALARGSFRAIAATTYLEYNKYFAKDAALERRFQPIYVGEPDDDKAVLMLRGIKTKYEGYHGIHITDEALEGAVKLSRRYIAGRQLPDKAVDLLDTAATRVKMSLTSKPPKLELLISELKSTEMAISSLKKDSDMDLAFNKESFEALKVKKENLEKEVKEKEDKWLKESELTRTLMELRKKKFAAANNGGADKSIIDEIEKVKKELSEIQDVRPQVFAEVTKNTVAEVIEAWTGIKVGNMTKDEMTTMLQLEDELRKRVLGQDHAIKQIADVLRGAKVGIKKEEGPIGVFMLIGTSGVGKTELARAVAEVLFGDERFMVTLNMTEYQNEYNTSRLIGADPGLVGYGEGGALSEPVRRRPYCVVLLDEIEKANSSVIDLFMQVFDRGMLQDADRRNIDFSNTIIFMTSNIASDVVFQKYNEGMNSPEDLLEELRPYLNQYFRPEFLGRVKPIVFLPLNAEAMRPIVEIKLNKIKKRLMQNRKLELSFDKKVVDDILESCTRAETGARNIDAIIDKKLAPEISSQMIAFMAEGKEPDKLMVTKAKDGSFKYKFS